ncbi:MAG: YihY/virulence factor BrkB family protein [Bacteroidales bacterium]|nr:YihY/virulence factor BrkB family protein [Bacteroidales bacterium]
MNEFWGHIKECVGKWIEALKNLLEFLTYDIWRLDFSKPQRLSQTVAHRLQVAILTGTRFTTGRIGRESVFLSFYSAMSLVPLVAIVLFVSWSFGLDRQLLSLIQPYLGDNKHIADMILGWANNIVRQTRNGLFGIISFLAFLWIVIWLMLSIEDTFNHIWKVKRTRNFFKSIGIYLLILILIPFVLLFFLYAAGYYTSVISELSAIGSSPLVRFFASGSYWLIFYGAVVLVLALMYKYIPHMNIKFHDCLKSSVWTGLLFIFLQFLYLKTQMMVTRMSGVYGAFAAIPLMMIWLNYSWQIILFGVYLTYSFENVDDFDPDKDEWFQQRHARRLQKREERRKAFRKATRKAQEIPEEVETGAEAEVAAEPAQGAKQTKAKKVKKEDK